MTPEQKNRWGAWLPVVGLCAAIFIQSCFATPHLGPDFHFKDKVLHMAAYGVLAVLFFRACRLSWPGRLSPFVLLLISLIFSTLYGLSDEIHQSFVKVRQADGWDVLADFAGSIVGAVVYIFLLQTRRGHEIRSHQKRTRHEEPPRWDGPKTNPQ